MAPHDPAMYGSCRAGYHPRAPLRPEVVYQRQRASPDRLNNSARRTYDLLRSTLVSTGPSMLLVESELTDALSASRNTVRTVLQQLAKEGLVVREPKNGTRAAGALLLPIDELAPVASRRLDYRSLGCPPLVRDRLRLPAGWTVLMIESLMLKDSLPLGISVNYIAMPEGQSLEIEIDDSDVILILERKLGIQIGGSHCTIGAIAADEQSAELVKVDIGAPLIWLEDLIEDETGQPRALSQLRLRGDRVAFSATARRFV